MLLASYFFFLHIRNCVIKVENSLFPLPIPHVQQKKSWKVQLGYHAIDSRLKRKQKKKKKEFHFSLNVYDYYCYINKCIDMRRKQCQFHHPTYRSQLDDIFENFPEIKKKRNNGYIIRKKKKKEENKWKRRHECISFQLHQPREYMYTASQQNRENILALQVHFLRQIFGN